LIYELYERERPVPPEDYLRVDHESLKAWVRDVFIRLGCSIEDSSIIADVLVSADLMGISSHGVQRVKRYVDGIKAGSVNPKPKVKVVRASGAVAVIDGDSGLGHPTTSLAADLAVEKAKDYGIGLVVIRDSHHFGIAGYYSLKISDKGFIGLTITNSTPLVAYTNTVVKYLGTNPIAVSVPRPQPPPILFDAATSVVPLGKIEIYSKIGKKIPKGWVVGIDGGLLEGDATHILKEVKEGRAAILPLGGVGELLGGHKGSGLAMLIDIFAGVLSGSGWGSHVRYTVSDKPGNVGHAVMALRIDSFMGKEEFYGRIENYVHEIKSLKKHPKAERIWIPGEKAWLTKQTRLRIGIPIHKNVYEELKKISDEIGIPFALKVLKESAY